MCKTCVFAVGGVWESRGNHTTYTHVATIQIRRPAHNHNVMQRLYNFCTRTFNSIFAIFVSVTRPLCTLCTPLIITRTI